MAQLTKVSDNSRTFTNGCQNVRGQEISWGPYYYVWTKQNQWKIIGVQLYGYSDNIDTLKRKKVLEYWPKNQKQKK